MGHLMSSVKEITNLDFNTLPTYPVKIVKAVRVENVLIMLGKNGKIYSTHAGKYAYTVGRWPWQENMLKALQRLGVLTQEQVDNHMTTVEKICSKRDKEYDLKELKNLSKKYGFKLSKTQINKFSS